MSTNKTQNLNLHSWEATDPVKRVEFNENFSALDANAGATWEEVTALQSAKAEIVTGTYTGDGAAERTISLGRAPKAVLVLSASGRTNDGYSCYGGLALPGSPVSHPSALYPAVVVTDAGFKVFHTQVTSSNYVYTNQSGTAYRYLAVF